MKQSYQTPGWIFCHKTGLAFGCLAIATGFLVKQFGGTLVKVQCLVPDSWNIGDPAAAWDAGSYHQVLLLARLLADHIQRHGYNCRSSGRHVHPRSHLSLGWAYCKWNRTRLRCICLTIPTSIPMSVFPRLQSFPTVKISYTFSFYPSHVPGM